MAPAQLNICSDGGSLFNLFIVFLRLSYIRFTQVWLLFSENCEALLNSIKNQINTYEKKYLGVAAYDAGKPRGQTPKIFDV